MGQSLLDDLKQKSVAAYEGASPAAAAWCRGPWPSGPIGFGEAPRLHSSSAVDSCHDHHPRAVSQTRMSVTPKCGGGVSVRRTCPASTAQVRGTRPRSSSMSSSASARCSVRTTSSLPCPQRHCYHSCKNASQMPAAIVGLTAAAAKCSGVRPSLSAASTSEPSSTRVRASGSWPRMAARWSGVAPCMSGLSSSCGSSCGPLRSIHRCASTESPSYAAAWNVPR